MFEIVENHPTIAAIRNGEAVTDLQLMPLEGTVRQELRGENVQLSESNIRKAFNLKVNNLRSFLRELFEIEALPDYQEVVGGIWRILLPNRSLMPIRFGF